MKRDGSLENVNSRKHNRLVSRVFSEFRDPGKFRHFGRYDEHLSGRGLYHTPQAIKSYANAAYDVLGEGVESKEEFWHSVQAKANHSSLGKFPTPPRKEILQRLSDKRFSSYLDLPPYWDQTGSYSLIDDLTLIQLELAGIEANLCLKEIQKNSPGLIDRSGLPFHGK